MERREVVHRDLGAVIKESSLILPMTREDQKSFLVGGSVEFNRYFKHS
jgi:hypothetical protein